MSNKHENLTSLFVNIADAIREKTGGTATVVADDFPDAIRAIEAGGGGGATIAVLPATIANNGMFEPGTNEYVLSNDNLHSSSRLIIIVRYASSSNIVLYRENIADSFEILGGSVSSGLRGNFIKVNENSIVMYGSTSITDFSFIVV